jgi:hypothetical protein
MSDIDKIIEDILATICLIDRGDHVGWAGDEFLVLRARLAALTAEAKRMRDGLPRSGDRVTIVLNQVVWFEDIEAFDGYTSSRVKEIKQLSPVPSRYTIECEDGNCMVASDCYSTREAAVAIAKGVENV